MERSYMNIVKHLKNLNSQQSPKKPYRFWINSGLVITLLLGILIGCRLIVRYLISSLLCRQFHRVLVLILLLSILASCVWLLHPLWQRPKGPSFRSLGRTLRLFGRRINRYLLVNVLYVLNAFILCKRKEEKRNMAIRRSGWTVREQALDFDGGGSDQRSLRVLAV